HVDGRKVIVEAKQEDRQKDGDFTIQQIRKSYELPEHADTNHLTSYVTPNNILVIEVPIRNPEAERRLAQAKKDNQSLTQFGHYRDPFFDYVDFLSGSDFQPHIVDKGEHKYKDENRSERSYFFKSTTLSPGTQVDQLKSKLMDNGQLEIEAPFIEQKETAKSIENHSK
ncbi:unnamed protein product, partial [Rotaria sp. Silwood2]